ncbi:MAG: type IX secretion system membrane protein PorP/SprF [Verrucomicrobia bacterium]|nr:type IX secretion system membrane protein PorP/SprF [Cytophagales bacterium]
MKRKFTLIIVLTVFYQTLTFAQQDAQFSHYMFNTLYFNPAFSGAEGFTRFQLTYRNQWTGYSTSFPDDNLGAITTTNFSFTAPIQRLRSGVGFYINADRNSPIRNLEAQLSYAYHYPIKDGKLSIGIRAGVYNLALDFDKYRAVTRPDPVLDIISPDGTYVQRGRETASKIDASIGVYYRTEKYYLGLSVNHLPKAQFQYQIENLQNALVNHAYFTAGVNLDLNYEWVFTPSVLVKTDINTYQFDVNGLFTYNKDFWAGLGVRQGEAANIIVGANMVKDKQGSKSLRLSYAFDFTIKGRDAKSATSNELLLAYRLPTMPPVARQTTRTPRFRQQ